jgi:hypothetical protein
MKFWIYVFFKLMKRSKSKAPKPDAYILFSFLITSYFLVFFMFLNTFGIVNIGWVVSGHNQFVIRFVRIPLLVSPVFMGVYIVYRLNKEKIDLQLQAFEEISPEERKKRDKAYRFLIWGSIFLLSSSTVVSGLLGHWLKNR